MEELNGTIADLEQSLTDAEEARKEAADRYEEAKGDYGDLKRRKEALDAEMEAIDREAEALRNLLIGYAEQQQLLQQQVDTLEIEQEERLALLRERLRLNFEDRNTSLLSSLFTGRGLYDLLTAVERLQALAAQDNLLYAAYEKTAAALEAEKKRLAESVKAANDKTAALHATLLSLEAKQDELLAMMADLEKDTEAYLDAIRQAEEAEEAYRLALQAKLELWAAVNSSEYHGGNFIWPLPAKHDKISSYFGNRIHPTTGKPQFHEGIDVPAPYKTEVYCVALGTVVETGSHYANGKYVLVDHGGGIVTSYAHLSVIEVKEGDILEKGDVLGLVGSTGWSTGNHLDLSVYVDGEAVDPLTFYPDRKS
jgi:murein DD-endopeptidase MepM/ murein hydrolase activator NlpD